MLFEAYERAASETELRDGRMDGELRFLMHLLLILDELQLLKADGAHTQLIISSRPVFTCSRVVPLTPAQGRRDLRVYPVTGASGAAQTSV